LVPKTSPLWNQTPKRKTLKANRKQLKDLLSKKITPPKRVFSPFEKIFSPLYERRHTPPVGDPLLRKTHDKERRQDMID
jgi:hypothetical protein